jgi:hypothetical protein
MEVKLLAPADRSCYYLPAFVTREILEDMGFNVTFVETDWPGVKSMRKTEDQWDIFHSAMHNARWFIHGQLGAGDLQKNGYWNRYPDPGDVMTGLMADMTRASTVEGVRPIIEAMQKTVYDQAIRIAIGEFQSVWAANKNIKGYDNPGKLPVGWMQQTNIWME